LTLQSAFYHQPFLLSLQLYRHILEIASATILKDGAGRSEPMSGALGYGYYFTVQERSLVLGNTNSRNFSGDEAWHEGFFTNVSHISRDHITDHTSTVSEAATDDGNLIAVIRPIVHCFDTE
jgi:hypothetical protein